MRGLWPDARPFPLAARDALADAQLRHNLRQATATIRAKRAAVVAEVPDWQALRAEARRVKDDALSRLPALLDQLEAEVTRRGGQVHRASSGEEANDLVATIARRAGATEVVKVKSMATQEIGLNEALAEAGISAVETDLAELIVQLGDDRPSHILVPAIHRNRGEIAAIFRSRMPGVRPDLAPEPVVLAEAARLYLRQRFLRAEVAVSGANFAVAETGTVGVVESEGNGRMCVTLPRTLISVLGVEKVLARTEDLGPLLQVLARSSTGERMNPYTSMWTGVTPGDGPSSFHLILLDNGRSKILDDPIGRQALACIRCSACLNVCPVYERTGGHAYGSVYPGPIGAILTPLLNEGAPSSSLPFASSLCGACLEVCPVEIDIPGVLLELRRRAVDAKRRRAGHDGPDQRGVFDRPARTGRAAGAARRLAGGVALPWPGGEEATMRLLAWVLVDPARLERAQRSGALASRLLLAAGLAESAPPSSTGSSPGRLHWAPGVLGGWTATRDAPLPPAESFRAWWQRTRGLPAAHHPDPAEPASARRPEERDRAGAARPGAAAWAGAAEPTGESGPARPAPAGGDSCGQGGAGPVPGEVVVDRHPEGVAARLALFVERVADYRARVHRCDALTLPALVADLLADPPTLPAGARPARAGRTVLVPADLPEGWLPPGVDLCRDEGSSPPASFERCRAVVTGCALAIAETGTIVLDAGAGQGRRAATLLPDHHVCVVRADQVVASVPEALGLLDLTRPLTWVSGPSATSDIELRRVEGVHGPRRLDVVVLDPPSPSRPAP